MELIKKYLAHIESIKPKINDWAKEAIIKNSGEIIDLVRFDQLAIGLNSYGKPLKMKIGGGTGFYAKRTQSIADEQGLSVPKTKGAPYNFQWTSDTFDSMGLKTTKDTYYDVFSIDGKQKKLERIYGEIFKLTNEHNELVNKTIIEPYVSRKIMEELTNF